MIMILMITSMHGVYDPDDHQHMMPMWKILDWCGVQVGGNLLDQTWHQAPIISSLSSSSTSWNPPSPSPKRLFGGQSEALWLPQVLNEGLSHQCTCFSHVQAGALTKVYTYGEIDPLPSTHSAEVNCIKCTPPDIRLILW